MSATKLNIQMVDLKAQYEKLQEEIDSAVLEVIRSCAYINGPQVKAFQAHMEDYLNAARVIPCANGTDALQIALMATDMQAGDEVIVPAFTYVSTAEVIALLGFRPVMVDVDPDTFNVTADIIEAAISPKTRGVVPVNLFGQSCDMEPIMQVADKYGLWVIEDNAQAIGADYTFSDGHSQKTGTIGHIGCTSFYPSKNLGAYGDGGAIYTNDEELGEKLRKIANHGQTKRYYHGLVGVNSRLDSVQAAILDIKLSHLDEFAAGRRRAADYYDEAFAEVTALKPPYRHPQSTHVFHQYTLQMMEGKRDELQAYLKEQGIPSMIYYPVPLYKQEAYQEAMANDFDALPVTEALCQRVISLPMHPDLDEESLAHITKHVKQFFQR